MTPVAPFTAGSCLGGFDCGSDVRHERGHDLRYHKLFNIARVGIHPTFAPQQHSLEFALRGSSVPQS